MTWSYGQWIDGNGSGANAPHADFFYYALALIAGSGQVSSTVTLSTSSEANSATSGNIWITLTGTTGSAPETLASAGIAARVDLVTLIAHQDIGDLTSVTVRLEGNNGIHFSEVRVDFGFGGPTYTHYTWLLTTLNGWVDGPNADGSQTTYPASRVLTVDSASPAVLSTSDGAADFMPVIGSNNAHLSVWGVDVASAVASLPTQDMTIEMWTKWVAGGSDWAGPISASQDDGATEFGWNIQTRCKDASGSTVPCAQSRRIEFSLATAGSGGKLAYLGYPGDASRFAGNAGLDQPIFADLTGTWMHLAYSYDGTSSKAYVDGILTQQDDVTGSGAIVYPADTYAAGQGGWFTLGAYHDANEYYSFPGAIDELKIWHVATAPSLGCNVPATDPNLNYYWKFDDIPITCTIEPTSAAQCEAAALAAGLALGGGGYAFVGDYGTGGCYSYSSGGYLGMAFYSTRSPGAVVSGSKFRVFACGGLDAGTEIVAAAGPPAIAAGGFAITDGKCSSSVTIATQTDTRSNAQSSSTFLITFYGKYPRNLPLLVMSTSFSDRLLVIPSHRLRWPLPPADSLDWLRVRRCRHLHVQYR